MISFASQTQSAIDFAADLFCQAKHAVSLTGAGLSTPSGIPDFRSTGTGLWSRDEPLEVASLSTFRTAPERFFQWFRPLASQIYYAQPNPAHLALAGLEKAGRVRSIITQNIDNLHERAGSTDILHLHGELTKARSTSDPSLIYDIGYKDMLKGDKCEKGSQLRPHIVWFGEAVPMMDEAVRIASEADIFAVIGSSLNVYPAAGLIQYAPSHASLWLIDPNDVDVPVSRHVEVIKEAASKGVAVLAERLLAGI